MQDTRNRHDNAPVAVAEEYRIVHIIALRIAEQLQPSPKRMIPEPMIALGLLGADTAKARRGT